MALLLAGALILIVLGLLGAKTWLEPHEHPVRFILFWFACGWITVTALLLALLDLLLLRAQTRRIRRDLRHKISEDSNLKPKPSCAATRKPRLRESNRGIAILAMSASGFQQGPAIRRGLCIRAERASEGPA